MARKNTRRRWRRPERMTLEQPQVPRRKHIGAPTVLTLETDLQRRHASARLGAMRAVYVCVAGAEGVLIGLVVRHAVVGVVCGAALGALYVLIATELGGTWIRRALGAEPARNPRVNRMTRKLGEAAGIAAPAAFVMRDPAMDALAIGLRQPGVVVATGSLNVEDLVLEGMIGHELVHIRDGDADLVASYLLLADVVALARRRAGVPLVLGLVLLPASLVVRTLRPLWLERDHCHRADVAAALLTRYPPGVTEAIRIALRKPPRSSALGASFWFSSDGDRRAQLVSEM